MAVTNCSQKAQSIKQAATPERAVRDERRRDQKGRGRVGNPSIVCTPIRPVQEGVGISGIKGELKGSVTGVLGL